MSEENNDQLSILEFKGSEIDEEIDNDLNPQQDQEPLEGEVLPPLREELADMLDFMARAGAVGLPTIPQRYNHDQNLQIADAAIILSDKYGYDLRANLLATDSHVFCWFGLLIAVGVPLRGCFDDYKAMIKESKKEAPKDKPAAENTTSNVDQSNDSEISISSQAT